MKILLAKYKSFPRFGGIATYVNHLYHKLTELGHQVDILAHKPGMNEIYTGKRSIAKKPIRDELEPGMLDYFRSNYSHFTKWMIWRELENYTYEHAVRHFDLSGYDIIHTQDIISTRCLARIKPPTVPLVVSFHNCKTREWYTSKEYEKKTKLEMKYVLTEETYSAHAADHLIMPCKWLWDEFGNLGDLTSDVSIYPYGIDLNKFYRDSLKQVSIPDGGKTIIACPARLVPIKGHTYLLSALHRLKALGFSFGCWMIGEGIMMEQLKEETRKLGLDKDVLFLGGRDDVPALLAASDIVVLPSVHDTLPFTVMESQLAGKPVVATNVGGIPEMIEHNKTGLMVNPRDSDALAYELSRLLSSDKLRHDLGSAAQLWAQNQWSLDNMIARTLEVYNTAMSKDKVEIMSNPDRDIPDRLFLSQLEGPGISNDVGYVEEANISGIVIDAELNIVKDAAVHLFDHSNIMLVSTMSDAQGKFVFSGLPAGKYSIMASKDGVPPNSRNFTLHNEPISDFTIML
ncbi:glycosyltransferase [Paenibacillus alkalitolerans]|uniref:glycosyltransferase n=1 Tax=Paenibacillus alkalitolerans TaxID=2799335 RepID=UPI0018F48537|nr:glycosyltransferase [Paenibacillus alkalitolerans]